VLLDTERCIMCSRCVRFCDEIAHKPQLTFSNRGDHVELTTFPGEQLDNPYAMNTIDICPVGALTSRDFRFKARVWEMSATETICPGCARGCNMYSWVRNNEILRQTPRHNAEVNEYWMCDAGRLFTFKQVNSETRVKAPMMKKEQDVVEVGWDEAIARVASEFKAFKKSEIAVVGSGFATNEDNFLLQKFARDVLGTKHVAMLTHVVPSDEDRILLRADKTPNSRGAHEVGVPSGAPFENIVRLIREGGVKALYVVEDNIAAEGAIAQVLGRLDFLVVHSSNENETTRIADVVFPTSTFAEKNGTFTNFQGRVQRIRPSVSTLDRERPLGVFSMSRLDKYGTPFDRWTKGAKRDSRPTWKVLTQMASLMGVRYRYVTAEDVFMEITSTVDSFKDMSYRKIGNKGLTLRSLKESSVEGIATWK